MLLRASLGRSGVPGGPHGLHVAAVHACGGPVTFPSHLLAHGDLLDAVDLSIALVPCFVGDLHVASGPGGEDTDLACTSPCPCRASPASL